MHCTAPLFSSPGHRRSRRLPDAQQPGCLRRENRRGSYATQDPLLTSPEIDLAVLKSLPTVYGLDVGKDSPANDALLPLLRHVRNLSYHRADGVEALGALTQLEHLELGTVDGPNGTFVVSGVPLPLGWLPKLAANLRELSIRASLTDAAALMTLTQLKTLDLSYNLKLADLGALAPLTALAKVDLSHTAVTDFSPLKAWPQLRELKLASDKLVDVKPFVALPLTTLDLGGNKIIDASPLAGNTTLKQLTLTGNPLAVRKCPLPAGQGACDLDTGSH